ncbi:unnamed protein product [Miscanthus lutarioriparius]|uniref:Avr9/Cf-9 rapidly elicited protein 146 n=1 Tax=Miscanthus lutarioriparius TaxID=422564 RepID=A0A811P3M4_9POAL|nr:unnamed protein product [Miscanthus lutarioriparius]
MAVESDSGSRAVQPAATGGSTEPGLGKRLMTVLRAVYHMLRRGLCRKRLMMDLHLLLGRGKLAGKALRDLLAAAHHSHHHMVAPSSSRAGRAPSASSSSALPAAATSGLSFVPYDPRDVEFSCTTTPSYSFGSGAGHPGPARALFPFLRGRRRARGSGGAGGCDGLHFAQVARALEKMHAADDAGGGSGSGSDQLALSSPSPSVAGATPSPMLALSLGRSPAGARRLRVTDSPFPVDPPEGLDARADSTFDAFISKFYETLRLQQADATPDNRARRRG